MEQELQKMLTDLLVMATQGTLRSIVIAGVTIEGELVEGIACDTEDQLATLGAISVVRDAFARLVYDDSTFPEAIGEA